MRTGLKDVASKAVRVEFVAALAAARARSGWRSSRAADADLMGLDATVRSGQFHDDPPLHSRSPGRRDQADP